jgi:hypothetical protein
MNRPAFGKALGAALIAVALTGGLWASVAGAQDGSVRVQGRVEWIAGQTMVLAPDGMVIAPAGTAAIHVDLAQADQGAYAGLTTGDRVAVMGVVTNDRQRVVASSIARLPSP